MNEEAEKRGEMAWFTCNYWKRDGRQICLTF